MLNSNEEVRAPRSWACPGTGRVAVALLVVGLLAGCSTGGDPSEAGTGARPTVPTTPAGARETASTVRGPETSTSTPSTVRTPSDGRSVVVKVQRAVQGAGFSCEGQPLEGSFLQGSGFAPAQFHLGCSPDNDGFSIIVFPTTRDRQAYSVWYGDRSCELFGRRGDFLADDRWIIESGDAPQDGEALAQVADQLGLKTQAQGCPTTGRPA